MNSWATFCAKNMGAKPSSDLQQEEIEAIQKETGFSSNQIIRLFTRFTSLDKEQNGFLTRDLFLRVPELAINPIADRIVESFFEKGQDHVNFRQFMKTLAVFRPITAKTPEEAINGRNKKLEFVFNLYDSDKDGKISKKDLQDILSLMVGANISPEQLSFIAERTILESDKDNDRTISRDEFLKAMDAADCNTKMSVRFLD